MTRRFSVLVLLAVLFCGTGAAFEAGVAKVEITPPLGVPLNGFGDRMGRGATSVHDPLWVRCLYLDDGETKVFLLTSDLCLITPELRARVLELAPKSVPAQNIILTATHTHNGPGAMSRPLLFRSVSGRFMPDVLEATAKKFAASMTAALQARKPATVGYGTASQQVLSVNRRHDDGPFDEQIGVVRVDNTDGTMMALFANFAAHPTTVPDGDRYAFSADYPGFFYTELEKLADAGCIALFANGAEGNQTCANPERLNGWARTESIGRLLAIRVKELANEIETAAPTLRVASATRPLPPAMASSLVPGEAFLQTLEIGDLLMTFVPGEPCVEIGQGLRQRALERGYGAQFTVGLSNDYLGYFVPQSCYGHLEYECGMNFYGPRMAEWFYDEFGRLMRGNATNEEKPVPAAAAIDNENGIRKLTLSGTPYEMGYARGAALAEDIRATYKRTILEPLAAGKGVPESGLWKLAPSFVDLTPLALPRLGIGARPHLDGLSADLFEEVEGLAAGAGLPFDAAWLLQCAPALEKNEELEPFYRAPFCTVIASVGERAAGGAVVGRNLDWESPEAPLVVEYRPASGHRFLQVGFAWSTGVVTGMNDAGVVVCAERAADLGDPPAEGVSVDFVCRETLRAADDFKEAVAIVGAATHLRGYRVLVAHSAARDAKVIEFGRWVGAREPKDGLLLGSDPGGSRLDDQTRERYRRANELLDPLASIGIAEMETVLRDQAPEVSGLGRILNEQTRYSVIFEPGARRVRVAAVDAAGVLGPYVTFDLSEDRP